MNKKIKIDQLQIGMYVISMEEGWVGTPVSASNFRVKSIQEIAKLRRAGVNDLLIDTKKGEDVSDGKKSGVFLDEVKVASRKIAVKADVAQDHVPVSERIKANAKQRVISGKEESIKAGIIFKEATGVVKDMILSIGFGQDVDLQKLTPLVERIIQSVERNKHALTGVCRLKNDKDYEYMHGVSVASLLVAFATSMELDEETIFELGVGGLIHDFGKGMLPKQVVNKVGKFTDGEYKVMMNHVAHNTKIFADIDGLSEIAMDVVTMHHEYIDGSGHPLGLMGDEISLAGKMATIVDAYDTLSSNRSYGQEGGVTSVLARLTQWCPSRFDKALVDKFIKCLGVYPVGSLVELNSGKVGIVTDQGQDMLRPQVRIIFDIAKKCYAQIEDIDMDKLPNLKIEGAVDPVKYKIKISEFL